MSLRLQQIQPKQHTRRRASRKSCHTAMPSENDRAPFNRLPSLFAESGLPSQFLCRAMLPRLRTIRPAFVDTHTKRVGFRQCLRLIQPIDPIARPCQRPTPTAIHVHLRFRDPVATVSTTASLRHARPIALRNALPRCQWLGIRQYARGFAWELLQRPHASRARTPHNRRASANNSRRSSPRLRQ